MIGPEEALEAVIADFPYIVKRISHRSLELDIGNWLLPIGGDMIVISKVRHGPNINFSPVTITYGFKKEEDAIAFKLRFA